MAKIYSEYSDQEPNKNRELATIRADVLKNRFLELYMTCGHIGRTCEILGMVPRTVYHWKAQDEQFKENLKTADEIIIGLLEDEAMRRAVHGVEKPVYQGGKLVGTIMEYSDQLLIKLLRAKAPERWRDELKDGSGKPFEGKIEIKHIHTGLQLASSEDEIRTDIQQIQDIEYKELPPTETKDDLLDDLK